MERSVNRKSLPWLSVANIGGFAQSTPKTYSVHYVPKTLLVDNDGKIITVDISTEELEEFLIEKFGSTYLVDYIKTLTFVLSRERSTYEPVEN
ncbi:MAG: hypothetical protein OXH31_01010 [Gammaproteobacteria bacterium]|nr:hypothetical protein [Gammaproteobacteria bacterium]